MDQVLKTPLVRYLKQKSPEYYGVFLNVRANVTRMLEYTRSLFPHYTSHSADHSDQIILQISRLLFDDRNKPVIKISATEAYTLVIAAYLHDAGMVVSTEETSSLITTDEWKDWADKEPQATSIRKIDDFRASSTIPSIERNYLADLQFRYILAEYYRRIHPARSRQAIRLVINKTIDFSLGNPQLAETIAAVCEGHGLSHDQLMNPLRYPFRRDIAADSVNVRLMSVLLRLGDLLDMRSDRACPILQSVASPLPGDSAPHWTQYEKIITHAITPVSIVIHAECDTQSEYSLLQDWCGWIVHEVRGSQRVLADSTLHAGWTAPRVVDGDGKDATITIRPSEQAKFIPTKWRFEFDADTVFERFIKDIYSSPLAFLRELIQNGLDATRCRISLDHPELTESIRSGLPLPDNVASEYALRVCLREETIEDSFSGLERRIQVLSVADAGIGMTSTIIQKYLLQVGQSFYVSSEFNQRYRFTPTSRFGVGFLSVFGVSEHVTVETLALSQVGTEGALRVLMTRPKSYLVTERGSRTDPGTTVSLRLETALSHGQLLDAVRRLCKRVEIPIIVEDGEITRVDHEVASDYCASTELPDGSGLVELKYYPTNVNGAQGEFYILSVATEDGESWESHNRLHTKYDETPGLTLPRMPQDLVAFHGVTTFERKGYESIALRVDYRDPAVNSVLSRQHLRIEHSDISKEIEARLALLVAEHLVGAPLARGADAWKYKQRLIGITGLRQFWMSEPATIRSYCNGKETRRSFTDVRGIDRLAVIVTKHELPLMDVISKRTFKKLLEDVLLIEGCDLAAVDREYWERLFGDRYVSGVQMFDEFAISWWSRDDGRQRKFSGIYGDTYISRVGEANELGYYFRARGSAIGSFCVINEMSPLFMWWRTINDLVEIPRRDERTFLTLLDRQIRYPGGYHKRPLEQYIDRLSATYDLTALGSPPPF